MHARAATACNTHTRLALEVWRKIRMYTPTMVRAARVFCVHASGVPCVKPGACLRLLYRRVSHTRRGLHDDMGGGGSELCLWLERGQPSCSLLCSAMDTPRRTSSCCVGGPFACHAVSLPCLHRRAAAATLRRLPRRGAHAPSRRQCDACTSPDSLVIVRVRPRVCAHDVLVGLTKAPQLGTLRPAVLLYSGSISVCVKRTCFHQCACLVVFSVLCDHALCDHATAV